MFIGIKKGMFTDNVTEELNVAFMNIDKKIEQIQRKKIWKTADVLPIEINGVSENQSIKIGNNVSINVKLSSGQNVFKIPIAPLIAFTVSLYQGNSISYATVDTDGTVTVNNHSGDIWVCFNYIVTV